MERPKSLSEVVVARLRREILEGEFDFGEALSESKIAARYGVSRTPVREAFARLDLEGLVRTEPQYGTFVFTMDQTQFAQISETRSILETAALRLVFERNSEFLLRDWRRLAEEMTTAFEAGEGKIYSAVDAEFHRALFVHAENPYLDEACKSFSSKMAAVRNRLGARPTHMKKSHKEHRELLRRIEADDIEGAVVLLDRHIRYKGPSFWAVPEIETTPRSRWEKIAELSRRTP